jgi:FkbM family methyltransferase
MDIKAFINNIANSFKTTTGVRSAIKKMIWLYSKGNSTDGRHSIIGFRYPSPIGKINLEVRANNGSDAFIISEVFEQQCYFVPVKNDITNILDLGANAGYTAVYFSKVFTKATIACVEPMPNNVAVLQNNLRMNNVNAVLFENAACVNDGEITMEIGDQDYGNKVHDIPFGREMSNGLLVVEGLNVNTIMDKLSWQKIDLMKIDIEGYEGVLLHENNSWLAKVDTIIMEIHEGITIESVRKTTDIFGFKHIKQDKGNWILSKREIETT